MRKAPEEEGGIRRLQVGCGPHNILNDWWNVDIRNFPGVDEVMDVTNPWRWTDTLQYVYGEHFLEHLDLRDAIKFLMFAGRSLIVGGRIRLSTPSLEYVLKTHFEFNSTSRRCADTLAINRAFHGWGHKFLYSKEMLNYVIRGVGFVRVEFETFGQSRLPELQNMERHGNPTSAAGYPSVWIIEAERGDTPISADPEMLNQVELQYGRYVDSGH